jgi:hypothetical protein
MIEAFIAAFAVCVLVMMSVRTNRRFRHVEPLPMQWLLDGSVTWTAPRLVALAFTPVLAVIVLAATVWLMTTLTPRPGQEDFATPTLIFVALVFVGAHAFHLSLIQKSLRRRP